MSFVFFLLFGLYDLRFLFILDHAQQTHNHPNTSERDIRRDLYLKLYFAILGTITVLRYIPPVFALILFAAHYGFWLPQVKCYNIDPMMLMNRFAIHFTLIVFLDFNHTLSSVHRLCGSFRFSMSHTARDPFSNLIILTNHRLSVGLDGSDVLYWQLVWFCFAVSTDTVADLVCDATLRYICIHWTAWTAIKSELLKQNINYRYYSGWIDGLICRSDLTTTKPHITTMTIHSNAPSAKCTLIHRLIQKHSCWRRVNMFFIVNA